ncbi:MAG TPA: IPT/TIG domain-containing protein [Chthoniobacterales bacterium]|nr:IPT/TIG domain-containing protein [Chthoniobacterales bacterium]
MSLQNVNPGDLITAQDWNAQVAALNALEVRVSELESGGSKSPPRITQILPPGAVTAGDTIRIFGSNFDFSKGGHSVFFGATRVIVFVGGSSDSLLILQIPDPVQGATLGGTAMTLTVGNLVGTTTQAITVKSKPVVTGGGIQFTFKGTRPSATPVSNATFFYDFQLKSTASEDLTVTIAPTIAVILPLPSGVSDPGLPARLAVLDADGTVRGNGQIALPEGTTKTVSLRLTLPTGVNGLKYSLSAAASAPDISSVEESLPDQQVGVAIEQPDPTITNFEFSSVPVGDATFSTNTGGMSGVDGTLSVTKSSTATIEMNAVFANIPSGPPNKYNISAVIEAPVGGWSAALNSITANPLTVPSPGGPVTAFFDITAPGSAAQTILRLTLTRQGATTNNKRTVAYRLILK